MTDTISKERVIENAQNIYDMFVSNYGFSSVLALDMKTVLDSLRSALAQQAEQGWQPISTAPKDGTIVLLHGGRFTTAGSYQPDDKNHPWVFLDDDEPDRVNQWQANGPTYWMPLPEFKEIK